MHTIKKVRIDKWLWSVRIFKTRVLATKSCNSGKVRIDKKALKPSNLIGVGDIINVKKDKVSLQVEVLGLIEKRASAKIAETCYTLISNTGLQNASMYINLPVELNRKGRPTKKERRKIDLFKKEDYD